MSDDNEDALQEAFENAEIFSPDVESEEEAKTEGDESGSSEEVLRLKEALSEEKEKYFRVLAEMENLRKRLHKEKEEMIRFSKENVIVDFLMPLDNFENALRFAKSGSEEVRNWAIGFEMILEQFKSVLQSNKVQPIVCIGKQFDPHEHEVIEVVETSNQPDGTVIEECAKGFRSGDRVIRPAKVKIARHAHQEKLQGDES